MDTVLNILMANSDAILLQDDVMDPLQVHKGMLERSLVSE